MRMDPCNLMINNQDEEASSSSSFGELLNNRSLLWPADLPTIAPSLPVDIPAEYDNRGLSLLPHIHYPSSLSMNEMICTSPCRNSTVDYPIIGHARLWLIESYGRSSTIRIGSSFLGHPHIKTNPYSMLSMITYCQQYPASSNQIMR